MDILTLVGLVLAAFAVVGGSILKGSGVAALWSGAAFVIVIVGTLAATLIHVPMHVFRRGWKIFPWILKPPSTDFEAVIERVVDWSNTARRQGLLGLEPDVEKEENEFSKKALQMLVDGAEPEGIRKVMEVELDAKETFDTSAAKMFESMGIYAPTLGIIGAVMGLMAVMQNLADPSKLGSGIAAAFVATIYGIGAANLILLPAASKLKDAIGRQTRLKEMVLEGVVAIAEGENPRSIEAKLQSYVT